MKIFVYKATPEQFEKIKQNWFKVTNDEEVLPLTADEFAEFTGCEEFDDETFEPCYKP